MNGLIVSTGIFATAWIIVRSVQWIGGMLGAAVNVARHDEALRDLGTVIVEKRIPATTLHVRTCGVCGRQARWMKPFDPEHGARFDAIHVCGMCKAHGKTRVEFNTDTWTLDAIRRLDPDHQEAHS